MTATDPPRRRRRRPQAGKRLRADLDAAQAEAALDGSDELEWSETEQQIIDRAVAAADRAEELKWLWDQEMTRGASPTVLVKLSSEMRACERQALDFVARVNPADNAQQPRKNEIKQRAADSRWKRNAGGYGMGVVR